jgi:hypothetical protein
VEIGWASYLEVIRGELRDRFIGRGNRGGLDSCEGCGSIEVGNERKNPSPEGKFSVNCATGMSTCSNDRVKTPKARQNGYDMTEETAS